MNTSNHIADDDRDIYASEIESACAAFIDPYNQTYKNYFCMLCNTDTIRYFDNSTDGTCVWEPSYATKKPHFSVTVDLHTVTGGRPTEGWMCGDSQFYDDRKVS